MVGTYTHDRLKSNGRGGVGASENELPELDRGQRTSDCRADELLFISHFYAEPFEAFGARRLRGRAGVENGLNAAWSA